MNLTYELPAGVGDNRFHIDSRRGIITTRGQFDRETKSHYTLPIFVYDGKSTATGNRQSPSPSLANRIVGVTKNLANRNGHRQQRSASAEGKSNDNANDEASNLTPNGQYDVATLHIMITDVNDHAPEFLAGSCYTLSVPENAETAVIHTLVANDLDEGINGHIIYSIIGKKHIHIQF